MKHPAARHECELTIQKSRFIGVLDRVRAREDLANLEEYCRNRYPRASHYCHAFNAGPPGSTRQIGQSDDGEPHGTAGAPMLNVLLHADVGEVGIVVVRYFGGTKLGKGGLARAYADTAKAVLESAPLKVAVPVRDVALTLSYAQAARVTDWADTLQLEVLDQRFGADVGLTLRVPERQLLALDDLLLQIGADGVST